MIGRGRGLKRSMWALSLALALALMAPATSALGEEITYQRESEAAYAQQLAATQIAAATINKRLQTVRVRLKDGRHVLARYPKHQEPRVLAQLRAKHVAVTVLTPSQAASEAKKIPVHHKLRYIAGAVLVAIIIVVGAILLLRRRGRPD